MQHETEKRRESFLILTFKWVKVSIVNLILCFFMIQDDPRSIRVDPTRTGCPSWSGPTFVPASNLIIK